LRVRDWAKNAGLSAAVSILVVGGGEGLCRLLERHAAQRPMGRFITPWAAWDGDFYTVKSAAVGWPPWEDYNSDGVRDREHRIEKPGGRYRVVCLGDSTTLGWDIRPEEAYPQVLQDQLSALGQDVEVFNVALGGWTAHQELIAYRSIARKYRPDQVVIAICLNDIPEMQNNLVRPPALLAGLHQRSALVRRVVRAREREIRQIEDVFTRRDSREVRSGFEKLFAEVKTLRDEVRADGSRLAVLVFPARLQVEASAPAATAQKTIVDFCAAERIPCLDLRPAFVQAGRRAFIDEVHFSPFGARIVAEELLRSDLLEDHARAVVPELDHALAREPPDSERRRLPALLATLRDGDVDQRVTVARVLGILGAEAAVSGLVATLSDPSPQVRAAVVWALGGTAAGAPEVVTALTKCAADDSPRVREGAAWALGRLGTRARPAGAALVPLLEDPDESVRWRAADALGAIGLDPQAALGPLLRILQDPKSVERGAAAELVGRMGAAAEPAILALVDALEDRREPVRWRAAWALGEIGSGARGAVPALVKAMEDGNIRGHVADALGRIGPDARDAVPSLGTALKDESASVRWKAAQALGQIGPAAVVAAPVLLEALGDPQENVRLAAIHAASRVGADARMAAPAYTRCLADPASRVRREAAKALGQAGPAGQRAVGALVQALEDEDAGVREEAATAMGRIGFLPRAALKALTRAAEDREGSVRFAASRALKRLHEAKPSPTASR
jgi:HEAT repeat protein